ncbi:hypothetical protein H920_19920 [Fukomys damarensis]|uniref:Uncharacterized protein n=1 Tax=Fukomys damarensis TaxID=885580 RepID=A0A091CJL9_FUKDA|nr:hypothetical protein H920_19920 [Fukomys damarensis]
MESLLDTVVFGCSIVLNLSSDQDRASSESDLYGGGIGDVPELRASPCPRLLLSSVLFFTSSSLLLPSSLRRLALDLAQASVKYCGARLNKLLHSFQSSVMHIRTLFGLPEAEDLETGGDSPTRRPGAPAQPGKLVPGRPGRWGGAVTAPPGRRGDQCSDPAHPGVENGSVLPGPKRGQKRDVWNGNGAQEQRTRTGRRSRSGGADSGGSPPYASGRCPTALDSAYANDLAPDPSRIRLCAVRRGCAATKLALWLRPATRSGLVAGGSQAADWVAKQPFGVALVGSGAPE